MSKVKKRDMLSSGEIAAFCTQIALILKSGIPTAEGVGIMCEGASNPAGKKILEHIYKEMEMGVPMHQAIASTNQFPDYMLSMVEIGEASGKLDDVMESLTAYYEREESISRTVRSAVLYPTIMIVMMVAVIIVLVVQVMPIFNDVFAGLGAQMTGFSLAVMNFGAILGQYSLIIVGVIAVAAIALWICLSTAKGKKALERFRANFFLTRSLYSKIASGRFASAMALMLSSGMDTDESLGMVYKLVSTPVVREKIKKVQDNIAGGMSFSDALMSVAMFNDIYARMINVAFKTGSIDDIMEKIAIRYEEETNAQINNIISIVEPSLVAVLSVIVGIILLSVMLPLMGIMAAIG